MMPKKYILSFILLAVLFGVYFYQKNIFISLDKFKNYNSALTELRLENQGLRQNIQELTNKLNLNSQPYLTAQVYSRYPFNNNQSLIIDAGFKAGVKVGWPVLTAEHYLLGKIIKVKADTSEVETVFSPNWRSTVKIGPLGAEALLVGGRQPRLEFISTNAKIDLDNDVLSVSPDLPLNLFVGKVSEVISQPAASLWQAKLKTDYDPNQLRKVFIITDYEGFD
ncbi:MAG: rod shape-determining protein MreC [Patescibacteria group bacterium]